MKFYSVVDAIESGIIESAQLDRLVLDTMGVNAIQLDDATIAPGEILPQPYARVNNKSLWGIDPIINQDFPTSEPDQT